MRKLVLLFLFLSLFLSFFSPILAQEESLMEGEIVEILDQKEEFGQFYQKVLVLVKNGRFLGQRVAVETGFYDPLTQQRFIVGDRIILALSADMEGNNIFYIADYIRRPSLILLAAIFILLVLVVGGIKGFFSLI
ncbi:MAG: hypothetical protein PHW57_02730, partial [Candidatus Shapirobacteria bacterium]|nr:hypothetical protein [Candidatus Shapirobacteria bacterium]